MDTNQTSVTEPAVTSEVSPVVVSTSAPAEKASSHKASIMKFASGVITALVVVGVLLGVAAAKKMLIAATVNGEPISRIELIKELEKQSGKQLLESMVQRKLLEQEAKKQGIDINQSVIDDEIAKIEQEVIGQGGTLDAALLAQGMTREDLAGRILLQKQLEALVADSVTVSDEEITAYMETNGMKAPSAKVDKDGSQLKALQEQARAALKQEKFQREVETRMSAVTAGAKIEYFGPYAPVKE